MRLHYPKATNKKTFIASRRNENIVAAAATKPSDNFTRSPATSMVVGVVIHIPSGDQRQPRLKGIKRGLRPAFLKEANGRICDRVEGHDADFDMVAEKQLGENRGLKYPRDGCRQLSKMRVARGAATRGDSA